MRAILVPCCVLALITPFVSLRLQAQEQRHPRPQVAAAPFRLNVRLQLGECAPAGAIASFCQGAWATETNLGDPVALHQEEFKIAVYSRSLDRRILEVAKAIETLIDGDAALKWSFLLIDRTFEGSTYNPLKNVIADSQLQASKAGLKHLSVCHHYNPDLAIRSFKRLQIFGDSDLVIMLISPPSMKGSCPTIAYVKTLKHSEITERTIQSIVRDIRGSRAKPSHRITPLD